MTQVIGVRPEIRVAEPRDHRAKCDLETRVAGGDQSAIGIALRADARIAKNLDDRQPLAGSVINHNRSSRHPALSADMRSTRRKPSAFERVGISTLTTLGSLPMLGQGRVTRNHHHALSF